ncbi:MAG: universal stress protein [Bacillota bacterium]
MYKKILLATDGSEHSKRAAENAFHIASCSEDSRVEIVFVIDPSKVKSEVLKNWNSADFRDSQKDRMKEVEALASASGVPFEFKFLNGEPGPTIVEYSNKENFDVLVVGSRGLNGLQEFMLGSVSHKIAKRANCPVLIVK